MTRGGEGLRPVSEFLSAVEAILGRVRDTSGDEAAVWPVLLDALAWLYRTEERVRREDPTYYDVRALSREGRSLGGLIYFRGEVEHAAIADPYAPTWLPTEVLVSDGADWKSGTIYVSNGTEWKPAEIYVSGLGFPELHANARKDTHGRREWYVELVAGRSLTEPLESAIEFLRGFDRPASG